MQQLLTSQRGYIMSSRCVASSGFRWGAEQVRRQQQRGPATVATGRTSPFPPSGNEGYLRNRDVSIQSNRNPYQSATGAAPFQRSVASLLTPLLKDGGTGPTQRVSITAVPQPNQWDYWITLGKRTLSLERNAAEATSFPAGVMWRSTYGLAL